MHDPALWENQAEATQLIREYEQKKKLKDELDLVIQDYHSLDTALELLTLDPEDSSVEKQIPSLILDLETHLHDFEMKSFLSGPYDMLSCYLSLSSGAGGVDAMDWTQMLLRMYQGYLSKKRFKTNLLACSEGGEAGIKSATLEVLGDYAYGFLKSEKGVHRLVRISPFDANKRRHTSFALVEVIPILETENLQIDEKDLRIDTFNASGHGGQNVQKNDTAVRIVHIPTQITVTCQSERSQLSNKEAAMKLLRSKLTSLLEEHRIKEMQELKNRVSAEWGNQIRSYVLQPYTLVKDNRTEYETANVSGILEGNLDELVWEYIGQSATLQTEEKRR